MEKSDEDKSNHLDEMVKEMDGHLKIKWTLGAEFRGMGHYNYAVITEDDAKVVMAECGARGDIAEHIIKLHNDSLKGEGEGSIKTCPDCKGSCVISDQDADVVCPTCQGQGVVA